MKVTVAEKIAAPREKIWHLITDIDSWSDTISGINAIEVLNRPETGVVGLKWKETRTMFGKEADETMWICAAEPTSWYETRAESHGSIYTTRLSLNAVSDGTTLSMEFSATPVSMGARLMSVLSFFFTGSIRKLLQQDLEDIRQAAES